MKDKLAFLRRRHTDSSLPSKDMAKTSPEVALEWSKAFENLLNDRCKSHGIILLLCIVTFFKIYQMLYFSQVMT